MADLGFWKEGSILNRCHSCRDLGVDPSAAEGVYTLESVQSNEIWHNSTIYMMTEGVACFAKISRAMTTN